MNKCGKQCYHLHIHCHIWYSGQIDCALCHLVHLAVLSCLTCFLPVDGEGLTRWLLLWHADDAGRAAVGAPKAWASHAVGPGTQTHALAHLRVIHHVPGVHRQNAPVEQNIWHLLGCLFRNYLVQYVCKTNTSKAGVPVWRRRSMERHGWDPRCWGAMAR